MNKKVVKLMILAGFAVLILSGCAAGVRAESTPGLTVSDSHVYLAYQTNLYQIDKSNGAEVDRFPEKSSASLVMYAPPVVDGSDLFFGDLANDFYRVSTEDLNQIKWSFTEGKGWYQAKAALQDDLLVVPCTDRNIYALDAESGNRLWTYEGDFAFIAEPIIVDEKVIVSTQEHHVLVLDINTGEEIYRVEMNGAVLSAPLYDAETGTAYVGSLGKEMIAFDLESGQTKWSYSENLDTIWATPILLDDELIFADKTGKILALDPENGSVLWSKDAGGTVIAGLSAVADKGFLVAREDGNLFFYGLEQSNDWTASVVGNVYTAPIVDGDQIFVPVIKADALLYTFNLSGLPGWTFTPAK